MPTSQVAILLNAAHGDQSVRIRRTQCTFFRRFATFKEGKLGRSVRQGMGAALPLTTIASGKVHVQLDVILKHFGEEGVEWLP